MDSRKTLYIAGKWNVPARFTLAAFLLALAAASTLGCDSAPQPGHTLRADLAAIRAAHGNPDAIGTLDATAPPSNLNDYRRPTYRTIAAR